jgi:hypothetical protein
MDEIKGIIAEILKKLSLFSELNVAAVKELAFLAEGRIFHKGETIFEESTTGKSMWI